MSAAEQVHHTLELLAYEVDDLVPHVYQRFFARSPDARRLMQDKPEFVQGRMLNDFMQAVIDVSEGRGFMPTLMETEVNNHNTWGVTPDMYQALFDAFIDTARDLLGDAFTPDMAAAWSTTFAGLGTLISPHVNPRLVE